MIEIANARDPLEVAACRRQREVVAIFRERWAGRESELCFLIWDYLQARRDVTTPWRKAREQCIGDLGRRCLSCGVTPKRLHIHHITGRNIGANGRENLVPLCGACHAMIHYDCFFTPAWLMQLAIERRMEVLEGDHD